MAKSGHATGKDIEQMANAPFRRESYRRTSNDAFKPVVVNTLDEVKVIISEMLNRKDTNQSVSVKANLKWTEESAQKTSEITTISEDVSLFKLLVDGMEHVKKWMELLDTTRKATQKVNEEEGDIPPHVLQVWNIDRMKFNVDSLIKNRLGGIRNGLRVRWEIQEGIFEFDPFTTKFFEVTDDKGIAENLP
jgi:hypothetical protein